MAFIHIWYNRPLQGLFTEFLSVSVWVCTSVSLRVIQMEGRWAGRQNLRRTANAVRRNEISRVHVQAVTTHAQRVAELWHAGGCPRRRLHRATARRLCALSARNDLRSIRRQLYALSDKHVPGSAGGTFLYTLSQKPLLTARRYVISVVHSMSLLEMRGIPISVIPISEKYRGIKTDAVGLNIAVSCTVVGGHFLIPCIHRAYLFIGLSKNSNCWPGLVLIVCILTLKL